MTSTTEPALTLDTATQLRFPPFPTPPDGVTLIPFTAFKASGIRVPIDEDDVAAAELAGTVELDGLGIPTIALRVKHVADTSEKKKKRKKRSAATGALSVQVAPERPKTWWEVWEELEDIRRNAYNSNETPVDRLCQAGVDFKNGRTWPTAQHGVQHVWDIYRIYIGLLQQVPGPVKEAVPAEAEADARSEDSDIDDDDAESSGDQDEVNRLESFLNDPELSMKIFFSSYFREKGLIWSEPRCHATPTLVSFFLRYLIRSRVFPEPEYERPIKRALDVTELARIELPNSWKLGRALPDSFSDGCRGLWGSMQPQWVPPAAPSPDSIEEPGAKRQKKTVDDNDDDDVLVEAPTTATVADNEWVDIAAESNPPIVGGGGGGGGWGGGAAAGGMNTDGQEDTEGWGTGWTDAAADAADIITPVDENDNSNTNTNTNPDAIPVESEILPLPTIEAPPTWGIEPLTLLPLLGPTMLPLTHTTGIVEQSTRRIVRVDPPRLPRILAQNAPPAEAVEEDLACRFARVVLVPWERLDARLYEKKSDVLPPTLLSTSRGVAVLDDGGEGEGGGVHRPWKDEIGVLVDPKLSDVFVVGMGLGAIWVEIVREDVSSSKKGKGKKKEVPKYWYMEQLVHQLPSFYIDKPYDVSE